MTKAIAKPSPAVAAMRTAAMDGRDLMGGTKAMRLAGDRHMPKFKAESKESYDRRLGLAWLFNGYRKAVRDMTGKVFAKPVEVDAPALDQWLLNADMQGRDLSTFARAVFQDAVGGCGLSFVMVDAPPREGTVTQAGAVAQGLRPYLVHLTIEEVLGWQTATVANVTVLSQVRIMEMVSEQDEKDEFAQVEVAQIRVLDRTESGVSVSLYRKVQDKEEWAMVDDPVTTGLSEITLVPFYANRAGFMMAEPLLEDLAAVNIAHWQSQADQRNILSAARVPILFAAGRRSDEGEIVISTSAAVTSENPDSKLQWVEHSGAAIGAGRQDLKDLEFQMEALGLQLLVAKAGSQSATGEALDADKETSQLAMAADSLKDCLEQALIWMGQYGGVDVGNLTVKVNTEFGVSMMGAQEMTAMLAAVNTGNLSRETFLAEMVRRNMIASDIDPADEAERIELEGGDLADGE